MRLCCPPCGLTAEDEAKIRHDIIERQLEKDRTKAHYESNILVLGPEGSGKSTIIKQMKLATQGFTDDERKSFKRHIFDQILKSVRAVDDSDEPVDFEDVVSEKYLQCILSQPEELLQFDTLPADVSEALEGLWADKGFHDALIKCQEGVLWLDSTIYFFDSINRISASDYIPSDEDILKVHDTTRSVTDTIVPAGNMTYRFWDLGHRRRLHASKWLHYVDNFNAVLVVVPISEYERDPDEDHTDSRLWISSIMLSGLCRSKWLQKAQFIVVFNRLDKFKEKVPEHPLKTIFPDYEGEDDWKAAARHINEVFIKAAEPREIYTNFASATDTQTMRIICGSLLDQLAPKCRRGWYAV